MAELKVEIVKISDIQVHPNADRMELAFVGGYQVCVTKDLFGIGMKAVYIPIDSLLPNSLEALIFGPDSKVKLHNHRVKTIKLRGAISQGMLIPLSLAAQYPGCNAVVHVAKVGMDMTEALNIIKYQPPIKNQPNQMQAKAKRHSHPSFSKYTSIDHLKKYWDAFDDNEPVIGTEKLHGTNFRAGWVPFVARTWVQKLKNIFGLNKKWEFVYGSHNVQLMDGGEKTKDAFAGNVYKRIVDEHDLPYKIDFGNLWYGEIVGHGIQTGYDYSYKDGMADVFFMDVKDSVTQEYLDFDDAAQLVELEGEKMVPYARWVFRRDEILKLLNNPDATSEVDKMTKPIEGFVIRPLQEQKFYGGRLILKVLSDEYLLRKDNSDWK
jgi:RNA ligase (TIGR02306 family)